MRKNPHIFAMQRDTATRGEVTTMLTVLSVVVITAGAVIGAIMGRQIGPQTTSTEAQGSCSYKTTVNVYKNEYGNLFSVDEIGALTATNDKGQSLTLNEGGKTIAEYQTDRLVFYQDRADRYDENDPAAVTLSGFDPRKWKVKEMFCIDSGTRGCPTQPDIQRMFRDLNSGASDGRTIDEFRMNCGVDLTYGWILDRVPTDPIPVPSIEPTTGPPVSSPTTGPSIPQDPTGTGNLEVTVTALNWPQVTRFRPSGHPANSKPQSCVRPVSSGGELPFYLSSFTVKAICMSGACEPGAAYYQEAPKRTGYVVFQDLPVGEYAFEIKDVKDRGYRMLDTCVGVRWPVAAGITNQNATIILQNFEDGKYETYTTEKLCTDDGGKSNLIQGIQGSMCYNGGAQPPDDPVITPDPVVPDQLCKERGQPCEDTYRQECPLTVDGKQRTGTQMCYKKGVCTEPGGGPACGWGPGSYCDPCSLDDAPPQPTAEPTISYPTPEPTQPAEGEITVQVVNRVAKIGSVVVGLNQKPPDDAQEKTVRFKNEVGYTKFKVPNISNEVRIKQLNLADAGSWFGMRFASPVYAQENGIIQVTRCDGGIEYPDNNEGDEYCAIHSQGSVVFEILPPTAAQPTPPPPTPPPNDPVPPGTVMYGDCPVKQDGYCAPSNLRRFFTDLDDESLNKLSAICWRESRGNPTALNNSCLRGGGDYSVGLFQINTIVGNECVNEIAPTGNNPATCVKRPDTDACVVPLFDPDENIRRAKGKFDGSLASSRNNGFCPWRATTNGDVCELAKYEDTYARCWR